MVLPHAPPSAVNSMRLGMLLRPVALPLSSVRQGMRLWLRPALAVTNLCRARVDRVGGRVRGDEQRRGTHEHAPGHAAPPAALPAATCMPRGMLVARGALRSRREIRASFHEALDDFSEHGNPKAGTHSEK